MGQAVLDLSDPLEQAGASATSADDLLAQLADNEIDRLLADAERDNPPTDAATSAIDEAVFADAALAAVPVEPLEPVDLLRATTQVEPAIDAAAPESLAAPIEATLTAVEAPPPAPVASESQDIQESTGEAAVETVESVASAPEPAEVVPAVVPIDAVTERTTLLAEVAAEATDDPRLPLWLRPLEWLSLPFAHLSEPARDFLGKAAIVTLINSAAIVGYVLFLRKN